MWKFLNGEWVFVDLDNPSVCSVSLEDDPGMGGDAAMAQMEDVDDAEAPADDGQQAAPEAGAEEPPAEETGDPTRMADEDEEPAPDAAAKPGEALPADDDQIQLDGFEDPAAPPQQEQVPAYVQQVLQQNQALQQQLLESQRRQDEFYRSLFTEARQKQQYQALEASKPKPPAEGADPIEHIRYQAELARWEGQQSVQAVTSEFRKVQEALVAEREAAARARQQAEQEMRLYREEQVFTNAVNQLAATKRYEFLKDPDYAAVFKVLYGQYRQANGGKMVSPLPLAQNFAAMIEKRTGAGAARQQQRVAVGARRDAKREAVRTGKAPPPVKPGRGGAAPRKIDPDAIAGKYGVKLH